MYVFAALSSSSCVWQPSLYVDLHLQFAAPQFGLSSAPLIFTKVLQEALAPPFLAGYPHCPLPYRPGGGRKVVGGFGQGFGDSRKASGESGGGF